MSNETNCHYKLLTTIRLPNFIEFFSRMEFMFFKVCPPEFCHSRLSAMNITLL
jgi:hypothetical protein